MTVTDLVKGYCAVDPKPIIPFLPISFYHVSVQVPWGRHRVFPAGRVSAGK